MQQANIDDMLNKMNIQYDSRSTLEARIKSSAH